MRAARLLVVLVLAAALLAASFPADHAAARVPPFKKVALLFLENRGYNEIIGSGQAPYLNRLAARSALATRYYAVAHPSLPNYLALTTGSTQGIRSDCNACVNSAPSLAGQLDATHISWRAYFESIPAPGFEGRGAGTYTKHYNPFAYSDQVGGDAVAKRHVVDFASLQRDLRSGTLPRFAWIAPNLMHASHNASTRTSDRYVSRLVPQVVRALGPDGVLFITWDEAQGLTGPGGGRVALIATGAGARRHVRSQAVSDHYSLLATLEGGLGVPRLGQAATASVAPLTAMLERG